jgi:hypothetical protein
VDVHPRGEVFASNICHVYNLSGVPRIAMLVLCGDCFSDPSKALLKEMLSNICMTYTTI